ncbi:toll/interleukin-1 receptor domain-containing protein [Mycobacterium sp. 852013-51886_SCH5428379]|uniref:toll/interleukin-1 receptor domain-containing protein n=1 Tax=Mycobacterium sp. 852013-51886_SCH5428379 TaxID=1834111 RepID=UPI000ACD007C|nr:toll/interleukin-1 receptor domain-containing protein [Mycobacterium sp. 852013-51886_SCH5428379]
MPSTGVDADHSVEPPHRDGRSSPRKQLDMVHNIDFFISYNKADRLWAEWIAWVLEAEEYTTIVQEWDFKPGGNFVIEMDEATKRCERTIAVLSQDYLDAEFTVPEWAAKFAQDPKGIGRKLIPVRVAACNIEGLLGQVIYCDLVGLDEEAARKRLLSQLSPGRTKPAVAPSFPGSSTEPAFPAAQRSRVAAPRRLWTPLSQPVRVNWRADITRSAYSRSTLELHTIPIDEHGVEARTLRELPDFLASLGRQGGLFDNNEAVRADAFEDRAEASSAGDGGRLGHKGIAVYRDRHVVTWLPLPQGNLGSVFDEEDVKNRLIASLALHADTGLNVQGEVALAVSVEPITMLIVGQAGEIERRSTAQFLYTMTQSSSLRIDPREAVPALALGAQAAEIADELTAKLALRLGSIR